MQTSRNLEQFGDGMVLGVRKDMGDFILGFMESGHLNVTMVHGPC